jgi:hypothetical protein
MSYAQVSFTVFELKGGQKHVSSHTVHWLNNVTVQFNKFDVHMSVHHYYNYK